MLLKIIFVLRCLVPACMLHAAIKICNSSRWRFTSLTRTNNCHSCSSMNEIFACLYFNWSINMINMINMIWSIRRRNQSIFIYLMVRSSQVSSFSPLLSLHSSCCRIFRLRQQGSSGWNHRPRRRRPRSNWVEIVLLVLANLMNIYPPDQALAVWLGPHETLLSKDDLLPQIRDFERAVHITWGPLDLDLDCTFVQCVHFVSHSVPQLLELWKWRQTHPHLEVFHETGIIFPVFFVHCSCPTFWFPCWRDQRGSVGILLHRIGEIFFKFWIVHFLTWLDLRMSRFIFDMKDLVSEHGVGGKPTRLNISSVVSTVGAFDGFAS